ncbi:GGDEF domain-containing protein [Thaumasiovibrio subtropicus]|uniref:GGDEF domain-containing protein n=1 Tax=Thaumasiovibrio subtropicus TaxID=1891207 RepID=UPI000B3578E3|nr:GGDEF domain-containing protein [Thaumasiovibrio subtropicus]
MPLKHQLEKSVMRWSLIQMAAVLLGLTFLHVYPMPSYESGIFHIIPSLMIGMTAIMAAVFHKPKLFFAMLLLFANYALLEAVHDYLAPELLAVTTGLSIYITNINLIALDSKPKRRILSKTGALYGLVLILQMGWGALVIGHLADAPNPETTLIWIPRIYSQHCSALNIFFGVTAMSYMFWRFKRSPSVSRLALFTCAMTINATPLVWSNPLSFSLMYTLCALLTCSILVNHSRVLAYRDMLTGVGSRRALDAALQHTYGTFTIAMLDIDHFKSINDKYGHDGGDIVLEEMGKVLKSSLQKAATFRYGGEEFAILFYGHSREQCFETLERLRKRISHLSVELPTNHHLRITASIGLADSLDSEDAEAVLRNADRALYRAKHAGRNQVSF